MPFSYKEHGGDGSTTAFAVPFPYLSRAHVFVSAGGAATAFSWLNAGMIQITPAPAAGKRVRVYRRTPTGTLLATFQDGSTLTKTNLDLASLQSAYLAEEALDDAEGAMGAAVAADARAMVEVSRLDGRISTETASLSVTFKTRIDGEEGARTAADFYLDGKIAQVRDAAFSAGSANTYATKAAAVASLASVPLNAFIQVVADETQSGFRTLYQKTATSTLTAVSILDYPATVETRIGMASIATPREGRALNLGEAGRSGQFVWRLGNYSAYVTADPRQIVYVPSSVIPATAGCWVREHGGTLNARWAGCVNDTTQTNYSTATDNAPALNALLSLASTIKAQVYIPSSSPASQIGVTPGGYGVRSTVTVPMGVVVYGDGEQAANTYWQSTVGTTLVALEPMVAVVKLTGGSTNARLIGVNGGIASGASYNAKFGFMWDGGARPVANNLQAVRCALGGFAFERTQNGAFTGLTARLNGACIVLINQARNNSFIHCTGENGTGYSGPDAASACLIWLMSDFSDSRGLGLSTAQPAPGGIDRNRWIGGIYERAPLAIKVTGDNTYLERQANLGNNDWYGTEFTAARFVDTTGFTQFEGYLRFDSIRMGLDSEATPACAGTSGYLQFSGPCSFSGGSLVPNRGITQSSNFLDLFRSVQSDIRRAPSGMATGAGSGLFPVTYDTVNDTLTFNGDTSAITMTIPSSRPTATNGFVVSMGGFAASGNSTIPSVTLVGRKCLVELIFTIEDVPAGQTVNVYVEQATGRRLLGAYGNGTQVLYTQLASPDTPRIRFSRGTVNDGSGVAVFTVSNISFKVKS